MRLMEEMILREGTVLPGGILKVGAFLNQRIDPALLRAIGQEATRLYGNTAVNKILTVEASGIAIAAAVAMALDVPMVFAKKHRSSNVDGEVWSTAVHSYTHETDYNILVSKDYLTAADTVLLVDDFLAHGVALSGLLRLCQSAGAQTFGALIAIEKSFQGGGDSLRSEGLRIDALAKIARMEPGHIEFCE